MDPGESNRYDSSAPQAEDHVSLYRTSQGSPHRILGSGDPPSPNMFRLKHGFDLDTRGKVRACNGWE
jgi:hypothetical protein